LRLSFYARTRQARFLKRLILPVLLLVGVVVIGVGKGVYTAGEATVQTASGGVDFVNKLANSYDVQVKQANVTLDKIPVDANTVNLVFTYNLVLTANQEGMIALDYNCQNHPTAPIKFNAGDNIVVVKTGIRAPSTVDRAFAEQHFFKSTLGMYGDDESTPNNAKTGELGGICPYVDGNGLGQRQLPHPPTTAKINF